MALNLRVPPDVPPSDALLPVGCCLIAYRDRYAVAAVIDIHRTPPPPVGWCWADGGNVWLAQQDPRIRLNSRISYRQHEADSSE